MYPAPPRERSLTSVWLLAVLYFLAYLPYVTFTKGLTDGLILPSQRATGLEILPLSALATLVAVYGFVFASGWWRLATPMRVLGFTLPRPRPVTALSGLLEAVIIGTTTLAYSFGGLSIVFMMLVMRGGVLCMAPLVDAIYHRRIHLYSAIGLTLSLSAIGLAILDVPSRALTPAAIANVVAYLLAYFFRLRLMTKAAKLPDENVRRAFLVEEQLIAGPVLVGAILLAALLSPAEFSAQLWSGATTLPGTGAGLIAALIGLCYFGVGFAGSLIYLDAHENAYAVPINRGSSVLAGLGATAILAHFYGTKLPSSGQLVGAVLILCSMAVLAAGARVSRPVSRLVLFVCGDNTGRSAAAEHLCAALTTRLGFEELRVESAGLSAVAGSPIHEEVGAHLSGRGLQAGGHRARKVDPALLRQASLIVCMSREQQATLQAMAPELADRVHLLDPSADIPSLHGQPGHRVREIVDHIARLVDERVRELLPLALEAQPTGSKA